MYELIRDASVAYADNGKNVSTLKTGKRLLDATYDADLKSNFFYLKTMAMTKVSTRGEHSKSGIKHRNALESA